MSRGFPDTESPALKCDHRPVLRRAATMVSSGREEEGWVKGQFSKLLAQPVVMEVDGGFLTSRLKRRLACGTANGSWETVMKHLCRIKERGTRLRSTPSTFIVPDLMSRRRRRVSRRVLFPL